MTLYLGTDPTNYRHIPGLIHYPVIRTVPLEIPSDIWDDFPHYTHVLFTSKNAVAIFLAALKKTPFSLSQKQLIAIGKSTASKLPYPSLIATQESQEGVIDLLRLLEPGYIFYPRSAIARKNLENTLIERGLKHKICDLYTTVFQRPEPHPDLTSIKEIIFTSPSTVRGFVAAFGSIPRDKKLTCIGSVTKSELIHY